MQIDNLLIEKKKFKWSMNTRKNDLTKMKRKAKENNSKKLFSHIRFLKKLKEN